MKLVVWLLIVLGVMTVEAAEPADVWQRLAPVIEGRRWDVPFGVADGKLLVLGGRSSWSDYKKPRPYDVLEWNSSDSVWENVFPVGKNWGPRVGACSAPGWKDERWTFLDAEGNTRPNWTIYGTFSLGTKYGFDPDTKRFYFFSLSKTFAYDPATRVWEDLKPETDPDRSLGGNVLWSSMCYDEHNRRFILFGGGNVQSERGDPGTWSYIPKDNVWKQLALDRQPPQRANSRLSYDADSKRVVLFGGDRLDQLTADTWTFDVVANRWEEHKPELSPSPRAGHALLPLGKGRVLLLGGYGYRSTTEYVASLYRSLPLEAWVYETATNRWSLIKHWDVGSPSATKTTPVSPTNGSLNAAVLGDAVYVLADGLWRCQLAQAGSAEETQKHGVPAGTVERRSGSYDPQWYRVVPPPEPEQVAAELRDLPANQWKVQPTPKRPGMNMDWGSAVFAPELDRIIRFSGGHSAYSGTAPQVYDVRTDRYSLPFAPELPIEFVYSNDQVIGEWSFGGNPWMTGHTYKSTGYDPLSKNFVFAPHDFTYFFDAVSGRWTRSTQRNPYRADFYNVTLCATPQGTIAWGDKREGGGAGLWRLDAARVWQPLPLKGTLPQKTADMHGLSFDSKRNRLLFFSGVDKNKGDVMSYDFATGETAWLGATGKQRAAVPSRETIYLPTADAVLLGARTVINEKLHWLLYDCSSNLWRGIELGGDDPIGKGTAGKAFNNSMGLMYDPERRLIWAVGQYSHVHVLRLEATAARALE